jgi:hypothetical protein
MVLHCHVKRCLDWRHFQHNSKKKGVNSGFHREVYRFSGLLRSEYWQLLTEVSGLRISPIFKALQMGPMGWPETSVGVTTTRCVVTQKSAVLKKQLICDIERHSTVSFVGRKMMTCCLSDAFEKNALRIMFTAVKHRCTFP